MNLNQKYKNKFSIGLSLEITLEEYKTLLEKYRDYIHSIYFSPPLGESFQSRNSIEEQFNNPEIVKRFYQVVELFAQNGILLDCVLNRPRLTDEEVEVALQYLPQFLPPINQITCLEKNIEIISEYYPNIEKIYSYNNDLQLRKIPNISKEFTTLVAGKYFLRDKEALLEIIKNGFKIKLLVNNGCSFNCQGCRKGSRQCQTVFEHNLETKDINDLYALQSFVPEELANLMEEMPNMIDCIKISNRTSGYTYLDQCLESYITESKMQPYIEQKVENYRLWSRLGWFNQYLEQLDIDKIQRQKQKLKEKFHA